jgi:hypothetical protein
LNVGWFDKATRHYAGEKTGGAKEAFQACCAPVLARARGPASSWKFLAICDPTF